MAHRFKTITLLKQMIGIMIHSWGSVPSFYIESALDLNRHRVTFRELQMGQNAAGEGTNPVNVRNSKV